MHRHSYETVYLTNRRTTCDKAGAYGGAAGVVVRGYPPGGAEITALSKSAHKIETNSEQLL